MTNFQTFKCRCSGIRKLLSEGKDSPKITEKQLERLKELEDKEKITYKQKEEREELRAKKAAAESGKIVLSDTCIQYLMDVYAWEKEQMIPVGKESMMLMQTQKGKLAEWDAVKLLMEHDNAIYEIHKEPIFNDYLKGEIDIYRGESVYKAINITDIKNSFDYPTFLAKIFAGLEEGQKEQVQGYCDITGAPDGFVAHCLVDNPQELIEDAKWALARKMYCVTTESPEFLAEWPKWERSMKFSHMSPQRRVHKFKVERFTEREQTKLYDRVKYCRDWLCKFDEMHMTGSYNLENLQ